MQQPQQVTKEKRNMNIQVIVSPDKDQFIIAKKSKSYTDIICPFTKRNGEFFTNFSVPNNRVFRIQALFNMLPKICEYSMTGDSVTFDCLNKLPAEIFGNASDGIIHFISSLKQEENGQQIVVDPRAIFQTVSPDNVQAELKTRIKFKTNTLKVFPIILTNGFILSIADKNECVLYVSLLNPKKNYVGNCIRGEINNITQHLFPIWPIFNINLNSKLTRIHLQNDFLPKDFIGDQESPLLLNCFYRFDNPKDVTVIKLGSYVNIPE